MKTLELRVLLCAHRSAAQRSRGAPIG